MARKKEETIPVPPPPLLLSAAALALLNGAWSLFLWKQLFVARAGGEPFCALGGDGCTALWDGGFASAVHDLTGLPVAAWGVVWSVAAMGMVIFARARILTGRSAEPAWSGAVLLAGAGAFGVLLLATVSALAGEFCSNCAITYVLVAAYGAAIFVGTGSMRPGKWMGGAGYAALGLAAVAVMLLYPAAATPKAGSKMGLEALPRDAAGNADGSPQALAALISGLSSEEKQAMANARARYLEAEAPAPRTPRALFGGADAPLRLTTFTDSGCGHCAHFHEALEQLLAKVPPGRVAVDQRVFPLDASCNSFVRGSGRPEVCLAAQVRLCLEQDPRALALTGWLHTDAAPLSTASIYRTAARLSSRSELEACVSSQKTTGKMREDIGFAMEAGISGTPYVLANGKPITPYLPFLYAMAITGGDARDEVFDSLPEPLFAEVPGHEGHDHP